MARIEYGHTWWWRRWLESQTHIEAVHAEDGLECGEFPLYHGFGGEDVSLFASDA